MKIILTLQLSSLINVIGFPLFQQHSFIPKITSFQGLNNKFQLNFNRNNENDDAELLENVTLAQLSSICSQFSVSSKGSKHEILKRLRDYSSKQIEKSKEIRIARIETQGVNYDEEGYPVEGVFYYSYGNDTKKNVNNTIQEELPKNIPLPNEKGERVKTIYSSSDVNDMTANAMNSYSNKFANDLTIEGLQDSSDSISKQKEKKTKKSAEFKHHVKMCDDFIDAILTQTGLPGFRTENSPESYVGFDPKRHISTSALDEVTPSILFQRGEAFSEACEELVLNTVAADGMKADDISKGGGHYTTFMKMKTFLEGFRSAEVRRSCRDFIQRMLESLVRGGVAQLDQILSASDDSLLNDDLIEYLNEMIRTQERKIRKQKSDKQNNQELVENADFFIERNITIENGKEVETINMQSPKIRDELEKQKNQTFVIHQTLQNKLKSGEEQLLILLKSLQDRLKVEAAFRSDRERGTLLKLLAYCLQTERDNERESLVWNTLGSSLDKLDAFAQLVSSSIDYAESTSFQLKPSKNSPLNIQLLKTIQEQVNRLQRKQAVEASSEI